MSPFASKKQARWMFANKPDMAKEWADETPSMKDLPMRAVKAAADRVVRKMRKRKKKQSQEK